MKGRIDVKKKKKDFVCYVVIFNIINVFVISKYRVDWEWNSIFKYWEEKSLLINNFIYSKII